MIIDNISLSEIMKELDNMIIEVQKIKNEYEKKKRENAKYKIDLNRLTMEIQKLS